MGAASMPYGAASGGNGVPMLSPMELSAIMSQQGGPGGYGGGGGGYSGGYGGDGGGDSGYDDGPQGGGDGPSQGYSGGGGGGSSQGGPGGAPSEEHEYVRHSPSSQRYRERPSYDGGHGQGQGGYRDAQPTRGYANIPPPPAQDQDRGNDEGAAYNNYERPRQASNNNYQRGNGGSGGGSPNGGSNYSDDEGSNYEQDRYQGSAPVAAPGGYDRPPLAPSHNSYNSFGAGPMPSGPSEPSEPSEYGSESNYGQPMPQERPRHEQNFAPSNGPGGYSNDGEEEHEQERPSAPRMRKYGERTYN